MAAYHHFGRVKALTYCTIPWTIVGTSMAQEADTLNVLHARPDGTASFVTGTDGQPIPVTPSPGRGHVQPMDFLRRHGQLFGVTDPARQLVVTRTHTDAIGQTHTTYRQVHHGIRVFSGVLKVHQNADGEVIAANGDFYSIPAGLNLTPALTVDEAVSQAAKDSAGRVEVRDLPAPLKADKYRSTTPALRFRRELTVEHSELVIVDPGWYGDPPIGPHLAYYIILADPSAGIREAFFVDAHTGEVLDRWTLVCAMRTRMIYSGQDTSALPGLLVRAEGAPPRGAYDVDAAYDYLGDAYDYFQRGFGRDSIDDFGLPLIATVRSTATVCPNAFWNGTQMVFCLGTVSDDVAAHELMHGVTDYTAELIYQNQPGQLNESYSDIFGELIDLFNGDAAFVGTPGGPPWPVHPTGPGTDLPNGRRESSCRGSVRWLLGEDARAFSGAIRDMWNPPCFDHPDRANSPLQICERFDNGGVHSGSGIPNHAFAMLTDGKTFNGYTVPPIGPIKAAAIWYRALTTYLTPASDFSDAFFALVQAASDLVGTFPDDPRTGGPSTDPITEDDVDALQRALLAVEMETPGSCGAGGRVLVPGSALRCPGRRTVFEDDFESGVNGWTVFNSAPPTLYDWTLTTGALPFGRSGRAWFCEDRNIGDCDDADESAVHSLRSPVITLPADEVGPAKGFPMLSFTHLLRTEGGWDGGNVKISVNGGPWQLIPRTAFDHNPYNARLNTASPQNNTNPLAGEAAWTGSGGQWGTSVADLSGLVEGGDDMRLLFEFGKNGCIGGGGWYVDDVEVYTCPDCDGDGTAEAKEYRFTFSSEILNNIGGEQTHLVRIPAPPPAGSDVTFTFEVMGDFSSSAEFVVVRMNFSLLGYVFRSGGSDCPLTPDRDHLTVSAETFNTLLTIPDDRSAYIELEAGGLVNPELCGGTSFITLFVKYHVLQPPAPEPEGREKNRYISLVPGNPFHRTALKVTLADLPPPFDVYNGEARWVGQPFDISELPGTSTALNQTFKAAGLSCDPVLWNWGSVGLLHVFGREIVPGATYEIQAVGESCGTAMEETDAPPLTIRTSQWGDVVEPFANGSGAQPDILDITAIITKFQNLPDAPIKARTDLHPDMPDRIVDIVDVMRSLEAFQGASYPFPGPTPCR